MIKSNFLKIIATGLAMLLFAGIFYELGIWQWHRAQATSRQGKAVPSEVPIALTTVDVAGKNIYTAAVNRIVTFQGHYVEYYVAPTQSVPGIGYRDLSVGLFLISQNRAILVVRGLNDGSLKATTQQLSIEGRLYPRQQEDHGLDSATTLGRLDPALVAGAGYNLFDGYVIAMKEIDSSGQPLSGNRVPAQVLMQSISGFYWQHISYVVIWWFMGLLVLAAPFISKRNAKMHAIADKVEA
jgi:cytochrome oxidase assembly protein ShyY1